MGEPLVPLPAPSDWPGATIGSNCAVCGRTAPCPQHEPHDPEERGFEGHGDFDGDPLEQWVAHQAAKGRL